ncbi:MAG TPA: hypothetical protein VFF08_00800 [Trueperaceae bacterium]|nr:hypothetical protein [Trueperaceae bacterium]
MSDAEALAKSAPDGAPRGRRAAWLALPALLTALALAACAPSARDESRPVVAIMNAPAQSAVRGAAEIVHEVLLDDEGRSFDLVSSFTMRFLESHTDLFHSRAAPSAARIARNQGAHLAVMVGAPVLERQVSLSRDEASRRVDVSLALEAQVVDPESAAVIQTLRTRTHQGSRVEANDAPLPDPSEDLTVQALLEQAAPELARSLGAELPFIFRERLIGAGG